LSYLDGAGNLEDMSDNDVVIIGGGAAGLSAALVLSRARRTVTVVDAAEPRNAPAAHLHGFLSRDGIPPARLQAVGREEVAGYGGHLVAGRVAGVEEVGRLGFQVRLDDGPQLMARRLLLATGLRDEIPSIPGLRERWGRDVLHCPYCHGYEVRDQPVAVLGGSPEAVAHAQLVRQWSSDVVLFPHTDTLTVDQREQLAARQIGIVEGAVARIVVVDDVLHGLQLEGGRAFPRSAVFVRPRLVPNSDLLTSLGCVVDDGGWAKTDPTGRTTVAGVWVAGNLANPRAQVITAAGEASAAAIAINADLVEEDVEHAVRQFRRRRSSPSSRHIKEY
jgi:thioredoxin reductase